MTHLQYGQNIFSSKSVVINASTEKVWDALTIPEEIKKYLHDTGTKTDWVVGHEITWGGEWNGKAYVDK